MYQKPGSIKYKELYRQLGINIAYYRKKANLSQYELSEKIGVSRTYLASIEAPGMVVSFSTDTLFQIADVLNVSIRQLFDFDK